MNSYEEKKQVKGFRNVFKYLAYFNKYKLLSLGYWLLLIISAGSSFLTPFALGNLVEKITIGDTHNALLWAVLFCLFETLTRGLLLARVPFFKILQNRVKRQVKLDTLHEGLNINLFEYEKLGSGVFITRLTNDLDSLANTFRNLSEMIVDLFTKMGYIVFVFVVNVWLGLFVTGMILVRIAVYAVRLHYYSKFRPQVLKKNEQINNIISETIPGLKDIKTLGLKDGIMNRINAEQKEFIKVDTKEAYYSNFWYYLSKIVNTIGTLVFVLLFIKLVGWGQVSALIFYTVYLYENNVLSFAYKFCTMLDYLKEMEINSKRVFEVANKDVFVHDEFGTHEIKRVRGKIEFKDVCFAYDEKKVLKNISFKIQPKTHVAFVGESGCGKSTIVALIGKLFDPINGKVLFDNVDCKLVSQSFGDNISMVSQSPYLFNLTIRENLQLANENATEKEMYKVLKQANAYDFVKKLPNGLDTFIGEGGAELSGGQKQRLCIARALLKNAKILIFDEATSALDNLSQKMVMETIDKLKSNKTIITIAHRLSTIENCDVIYFVENGQINSFGTHQYLLENNKKYAMLYKKQSTNKNANQSSE